MKCLLMMNANEADSPRQAELLLARLRAVGASRIQRPAAAGPSIPANVEHLPPRILRISAPVIRVVQSSVAGFPATHAKRSERGDPLDDFGRFRTLASFRSCIDAALLPGGKRVSFPLNLIVLAPRQKGVASEAE
jgi:hypothetical protein